MALRERHATGPVRAPSPTITAMSIADAALILDNALSAHQQWRAAIHVAVATGKRLEVAPMRQDDGCELGRWLHGEGQAQHRTRPLFTELIHSHQDFHVVASVVASILKGKSPEQAVALMEGNSKFAASSRALGIAIMRLKGELQKLPEADKF